MISMLLPTPSSKSRSARYIVEGLYVIIKVLIKVIGFDEYFVKKSIGLYDDLSPCIAFTTLPFFKSIAGIMFMMKKILIFEYITGGGLIEKKVENSLLFEAQIILNSFINTSNYDVDFFL